MRNDNRGLSLVEVIIVVSIVAVLGGLIIGSTGVIGRYRAKECAKKTMSAINNTKVHAMSKSLGGTIAESGSTAEASNVYAHFYENADKNFVCDIYANSKMLTSGEDPIESKVLVKNKVLFEYQYKNSPDWIELAPGNDFYIGFNRSTGGFLPRAGGSYINKIRIRGGSADYMITLYQATGKSELKMQ